MDEMLLRHAQKQGAQVFEETVVNTIEWSGDDPKTSRPIAASYTTKQGCSVCFSMSGPRLLTSLGTYHL